MVSCCVSSFHSATKPSLQGSLFCTLHPGCPTTIKTSFLFFRNQAEMAHTCRGTINLANAFIHTEDSCSFVISNGGKSKVPFSWGSVRHLCVGLWSDRFWQQVLRVGAGGERSSIREHISTFVFGHQNSWTLTAVLLLWPHCQWDVHKRSC